MRGSPVRARIPNREYALPSGRQTGPAGLAGPGGHKVRGVDGAIQQRDAADEAGASDGASQLIASVGLTEMEEG
jgi:hypothetical protein